MTEKNWTRSRANQNGGIDTQNSERKIAVLSFQEYWFVAAKIPIGIPIRMAIVIAARDSLIVDGSALVISFMTGRPLL